MYILPSPILLFCRVVEMPFPFRFSHFGKVDSPMTANNSSCAAFIASCDHSNLSSERCERLDGESALGCGWGAYGEGTRMAVPGDAREVLRIERNAAEVVWRRFGGVKENGLD